MNLNMEEKKVLFDYASPDYASTLESIRKLAELAIDPEKCFLLKGLVKKLEQQTPDDWHQGIYQILRTELTHYHQSAEFMRSIENHTELP